MDPVTAAGAAAVGTGLSAAAATATGAGGAVAFKYNRENFLTDRLQRRRAAVHVMNWRVEQSKLWRQDVRDLISLTEYKMQMYLIVNIFLFGCTIFLYTEGKLPMGTPHWLMVGNIISIGAAFVFLLLSIWLAMHAAVSAQSFEARILTQMVRLPIPSWEELESARTYASEFEKVEGRQMFRVPWAMGQQEDLVGQPNPSMNMSNPDDAAGAGSAAVSPSSNAPAGATDASEKKLGFADPWGLEKGVTAEDIPELGCPKDQQVKQLRHVKLTRQAAVQWQSYDAFSRISMSIGVQQLMQAGSYYIIGYLLVQVGSKMAAIFGVAGFSMIANTTISLDMKSPKFAWWKLRLAQMMLSLGPACSTLAAFCWADFSNSAAEFIVPIAFISHGLYFGLIAAFCGESVRHSGSELPVAFRATYFLDAFMGQDDAEDFDSPSEHACHTRTGTSLAKPAENLGATASRPALQAVRYENGMPVPSQPQQMFANIGVQDLRAADRSPDLGISRQSYKCGQEEFYNPSSFLDVQEETLFTYTKEEHEEYNLLFRLQEEFGFRHWKLEITLEDNDGEQMCLRQVEQRAAIRDNQWPIKVMKAHAGRTNDPREMPWRVFCVSMFLCGFVWLGAAIYCIHGARTQWSLDLPVVEIRHPEVQQVRRAGYVGPELSYTGAAPWFKPHTDGRHSSSVKWEPWTKEAFGDKTSAAEMLAQPASFLATRPAVVADNTPEQIQLTWPWPNISPSRLTCDVSGSFFVMADRISMYSAVIVTDEGGAAGGQNHRAVFNQLGCPAVLGEGLEDVAMSCGAEETSCEVLALHRHGRRLAGCPLLADASLAASNVSNVEEISEKWLENFHPKHASERGKARSRMEKPVTISINPECKRSEVGADLCTVLATTHGRVVQLGRHSVRNELIPTEVLYEDKQKTSPGSHNGPVRAFNRQYLGLLKPKQSTIQILDLKNGGRVAGTMDFALSKPAASFCTGGGHAYVLTQGSEPELWRMAVPQELMPDTPLSNEM